jgi:hypothetical protein
MKKLKSAGSVAHKWPSSPASEHAGRTKHEQSNSKDDGDGDDDEATAATHSWVAVLPLPPPTAENLHGRENKCNARTHQGNVNESHTKLNAYHYGSRNHDNYNDGPWTVGTYGPTASFALPPATTE